MDASAFFAKLRAALEERLETEIAGLISDPKERTAGRIAALQEVLQLGQSIIRDMNSPIERN